MIRFSYVNDSSEHRAQTRKIVDTDYCAAFEDLHLAEIKMKYLGLTAVKMVRRRKTMFLLRELAKRVYANHGSLFLCCDLRQLCPISSARIPLTIRKVEKRDVVAILLSGERADT